MKRFLSILLVISLLISIVPFAFAEEETVETEVNNYKFVYDFNNGTYAKSTYLSKATSMDATYNMWSWLTASSSSDTGKVQIWSSSWKVQATFSKTTQWFALKIKVPVPGTYDVTFSHGQSASSGGYGDVYIFDKNVDTIDEINAAIAAVTNDQKLFSDVAYYNTSNVANGVNSVKEDHSFTDTEYVLVFKPSKKGASGYYQYPRMLTLTSGTGTDTVVTGLSSTIDTTELDTEVNKDANMTVTAYKSDFTKADVTADASYAVDPANVATASAGKITAKSGGMATVTASLDNGIGENVATSQKIDVVEAGMSGVTVAYDLSNARDTIDQSDFRNINYGATNGFFEYARKSTGSHTPDSDDFAFKGTKGSGRNGVRLTARKSNIWFAMKINVPVSGRYTPKATYWKYGGRGDGAEAYMDYYLIKNDGSDMNTLLSADNLTPGSDYYIGEKPSVDSTLTGGQSVVYDEAFDNKLDLDAGEYYLVYKTRNIKGSSNYAMASNFTLDGGEGSAVIMSFTSDKDEITAGKESAKVSFSAKLTNPEVSVDSSDNHTYTFASAELSDIAYSVASDDAEVASVSANGTVTGKSYGVATVNASAKYNEETLYDSLEISVVTPPAFDDEITYEEEEHIGGNANVFTFNAFSADGKNLDIEFENKENITLGKLCTVSTEEAIEIDGTKYNFLYWAKGATMARKQIVSTSASFEYLPGEGSNYLIAVYEPESGDMETKVEFYNGNGQLLPNVALTDGKYLPDYPSMAGFGKAYGWALKDGNGYVEYSAGDDVSALSGSLIFVAQYEDLKSDITVFVNGVAREVKYGDVVACTADSSQGEFMYWQKNGEIVSFDDTYSFFAWEDCRVEAVYGENKPSFDVGKAIRKIILDRFRAGDEMAIMAEFIGFDDAVEKGIMYGNQKIPMTSRNSQFTVLDDTTVANTAYAYAIIPFGDSYKMIRDGIAHIGVRDEDIIAARQQIALDYMRKMATVLWTPSEDITYTTGSSSNALSFTLEKGKVYRGVPYAYNSGSLETFMEFESGKDANGVYTISGLSGEALSGGQGTVRIGNDCSGSVVRSWSKFGANIQAKATSNMTEKNGFIKVGDYDYDVTSFSSSSQTIAITEANGKDKMFAAYAELRPADAVVHYLDGYGHVMMISEVDVKNQKVKIIDQTRAHMKTWGTGDEDTMEIDGVGTVYNIYGEDVEYSFSQLYNAGYLPITCRELREANYIAENVSFRDSLGEESHTLRNMFAGTISSTRAIDTVMVTILSGDTTVQSAKASVARGNIFAFNMQQFKTDPAATIRGTGIDVDALSSGTYTCKVTVRLTAETTEHEVRSFTFTK
ncbi:MAG: Ig-like domain-containing protein [Oscillospiraceae bacterium]|nr:Ig-like domain-containing protein [Oscillospiraceae bacterium]